MDSKLKKQFESSDNSLVFVHILLLITSVVLAIGSMIAGIIMWGNADLGSTHYNHTLTGLGFAFFFGGPVLFFVGYKLAMAAVWLMFDIKVIRTAVTGSQLTESLSSFSKPSGKSADSTITASVDGPAPEAKEKTGDCELCGAKNVPVVNARIVNEMGTLYRCVCADCLKNNKATTVK